LGVDLAILIWRSGDYALQAGAWAFPIDSFYSDWAFWLGFKRFILYQQLSFYIQFNTKTFGKKIEITIHM
jgi:hypothetical protein